jgi:hypothetical protein
VRCLGKTIAMLRSLFFFFSFSILILPRFQSNFSKPKPKLCSHLSTKSKSWKSKTTHTRTLFSCYCSHTLTKTRKLLFLVMPANPIPFFTLLEPLKFLTFTQLYHHKTLTPTHPKPYNKFQSRNSHIQFGIAIFVRHHKLFANQNRVKVKMTHTNVASINTKTRATNNQSYQ